MESVVGTADNVEVARVSVEREVGFGGAYAVGAWKRVFDVAAQLTVGGIKTKLRLLLADLPAHAQGGADARKLGLHARQAFQG